MFRQQQANQPPPEATVQCNTGAMTLLYSLPYQTLRTLYIIISIFLFELYLVLCPVHYVHTIYYSIILGIATFTFAVNYFF